MTKFISIFLKLNEVIFFGFKLRCYILTGQQVIVLPIVLVYVFNTHFLKPMLNFIESLSGIYYYLFPQLLYIH